jgi:hypothetical protein
MLKTIIKHGVTEPSIANLENFQLGFSTEKQHLYINNNNKIVDLMSWPGSDFIKGVWPGWGIKIDTGLTFDNEKIWRMYITGKINLNKDFGSKSVVNVKSIDPNNSSIQSDVYVTGLFGYGGFVITTYTDESTDVITETMNTLGYVEYGDGTATSIFLIPVATKMSNNRFRLQLVGSKYGDFEEVDYKCYIDFTDGTLREEP